MDQYYHAMNKHFSHKYALLIVCACPQVHGAGVWAASAVQVGVRVVRCGALTWRAGPPFTPTALSPRGRQTNKAAFASATFTRICTTGGWVRGTGVFPYLCGQVPGVLAYVCKAKRASKHGR